ncbi:MAG: dTDP-glucose 4,6-dehydratase [Candidatus Eisenbacteria bacterium]|nr:dTDP-glucose 4,6-dehydratase [Candidatus Eisenbacteria bacterium]
MRPVETGRYLVTGGAGFIGTNFVHECLRRHPQAQVTVLDKLTYAGNPRNLDPVRNDPRFRFVQGDIADAAIVEPLIAEGFDFVINFAAETHVDRSIGDPASFVKTDVFGVYTLLEAVRKHPVSLFVQISTDEVYGEILDGAATEQSPLLPRNPYSASKAGGDRLAYSYWATYDIPVAITRCSNNYGPYQYPEKLVPLFVTNALQGEKLPVYGSGKNTRDWIHALDHVNAIFHILAADGVEGEVWNIGAENERSVLEIGGELLRLLGKTEALLASVVDRPGHDRRYAVDSSKLRAKTGWKCEVPFEQGLAETVRWYEENADWWRPLKSGEFLDYYKRNYKFL